ncbi:hypothetical protein HDF24_04810 [Mucilaginibacter sp. X4EP1]|uniref:hypothetical protein n=1 Tax=Mucilaginibacter sp. X4EP1 TaxID=2723092 RepID=UPI002167A3BC|nr:hypothetical protein [Mucilaginibacter sp. X4EP1]MCS3816524.1 hypothetical protein [Mucilaginibacter sp. X4EP1]
MKPYLLFPSGFKIIGFILLVPGFALAYLYFSQNYTLPPPTGRPLFGFYPQASYTFIDESATTFIIIGLLFIAFSRLKNEQGAVHKLRLKALYWAVMVNCFWITLFWIGEFLNDVSNIHWVNFNMAWVTVIYNLFTLLLLFIARFYYLLYKHTKSKKNVILWFLPYQPYNLIAKIGVGIYILLLIATVFIKINDKYAPFMYLLPIFLLLWLASWNKGRTNFTTVIRLKAMQIAVYINYLLFIMATWIFYDIDYLVALFFGLLSLQTIFLAAFHIMLNRASKMEPLFEMI